MGTSEHGCWTAEAALSVAEAVRFSRAPPRHTPPSGPWSTRDGPWAVHDEPQVAPGTAFAVGCLGFRTCTAATVDNWKDGARRRKELPIRMLVFDFEEAGEKC